MFLFRFQPKKPRHKKIGLWSHNSLIIEWLGEIIEYGTAMFLSHVPIISLKPNVEIFFSSAFYFILVLVLESNSGPDTCKAGTVPLSYISNSYFQAFTMGLVAALNKTGSLGPHGAILPAGQTSPLEADVSRSSPEHCRSLESLCLTTYKH